MKLESRSILSDSGTKQASGKRNAIGAAAKSATETRRGGHGVKVNKHDPTGIRKLAERLT